MVTKALKILGITLASVIVLIGVVSAFLSPKSHLERSVVINAQPTAIFEQINTVKNLNQWQPWSKQDPDIKMSYEGPESGVGAKVNWESEKMGNGSQWIIESVQDKHLKTGMQFADFDGTYSSEINLEPAEGGTKVTWTYDGDVTGSGMATAAMGKIMNLFLDGMLGKDYEQGLNNLKTLAESQPAPQPQSPVPADTTVKK
ncbi:MAG: SRPBCC family protein [Bacteroidetes bacterium]|nr:SRPBCC family protein [Bacteroidota bacterium]